MKRGSTVKGLFSGEWLERAACTWSYMRAPAHVQAQRSENTVADAISPLTAEQLQQRRRAPRLEGWDGVAQPEYTVSVLTDPLSCADLRVYRLMEEACLLPCRAQESAQPDHIQQHCCVVSPLTFPSH
jgi:hypothetical protein